MAIATYTCERCGDSLSIAGENHGSDEDYAAEQHFDETVEWHESGQCKPVAAACGEQARPRVPPRQPGAEVSHTSVTISIEVDRARLRGYDDAYLATLWHVAQANPADGFADREPGELAEAIGREIIRRWLGGAEPELYHHQGSHYYWDQLRRLGSWKDGVFVPDAIREDASEVSV